MQHCLSFSNLLLIPWSKILLDKPVVTQPVKEFCVFYDTRKFISVFTTARQINSVHTLLPYFPKIHSNIILPSMPRSYESFFPLSFPTKTLYEIFISPMRATRHAHLIFLNLIHSFNVKFNFCCCILTREPSLWPIRQPRSIYVWWFATSINYTFKIKHLI
jgi:hypothetical protein